MQMKLNHYLLKIDCYNYKMFYVSLKVHKNVPYGTKHAYKYAPKKKRKKSKNMITGNQVTQKKVAREGKEKKKLQNGQNPK